MREFLMVLGLFGLLGCNEKHATPSVAAPVVRPKTAVAAFHDRLAPIWHTEDTSARLSGACSAAGSLVTLATRIVDEPPPPSATPAFSAQAKSLKEVVRNLEAACAAQGEVAAAFTAVHEAFHSVSACSGE